MYVGHYAAAFALKAKEPKLSLAWLFLAVQFVDIVYFPLTLLGIEKFNIIENFTESTHFELIYMPYTHSLLATILWTLLTYIFIRYLLKADKSTSILFSLAVLSHWFLDLLVHTPDLPLWSDDSIKLGFGLWNNALLAYSFESLILVASAGWMWQRCYSGQSQNPWKLVLFVALLLISNAINIFGPLVDSNPRTFALTALSTYFIFAGLAYAIDIRQ